MDSLQTAPGVQLDEVDEEARPVLENLAQLYQYDFTDFGGGDIGPDGRFGFVDFGWLFAQEVHRAYLIRVDGLLAGFATAYRGPGLGDTGEELWWMDQFFVMRRYRRRGVGEHVARAMFDRLDGAWEVAEIAPNVGAQTFWRKVIDRYTNGDYEEFQMNDERWRGPVQYFRTRAAAGSGTTPAS